jgi:hypothetical protein
MKSARCCSHSCKRSGSGLVVAGAWVKVCIASLRAAEDDREHKGNDLPHDSVAAGLPYARFHVLGGAHYHRAIGGICNGLAASLFEYRVAVFIPENGVDAKTESRQVAVVCRFECIDRVRFDTHRLRIDISIGHERSDERVRVRFAVELSVERVGAAQDWGKPSAYCNNQGERSEDGLGHDGGAVGLSQSTLSRLTGEVCTVAANVFYSVPGEGLAALGGCLCSPDAGLCRCFQMGRIAFR